MPKIGRINCNPTIGKDCVIQDDVIIGNSDKNSVIIGDNALIRSGSIIYSKVKIGNGFKTGHRALIRENSELVIVYLLGLMQYSIVIEKAVTM
jgi:UDP-3-O-[3-hydroxymyristoyl] glucosamine N-acyltransferase